ncbi:MAG: DUF2442 domain-containing protein [Bacteroidota bacterium]
MNYIPKEVKALADYKIWVKFEDGTSGEVDLSNEAGKGIFKFWNNRDNFKKVFINNETDGIAWNDELEICPETVYNEIVNNTINVV